MVKKYTSFLLIGLLVIHLAGFYLYFMVQLGGLRMSMREKLETLPAAQLTAVQIPAHQFRTSWLAEREMKWMGTMYDIARVERSGNSVIVYCLADKDEENLLSFISAVVEMSSQDNRQTPPAVTQFFGLKFIVPVSLLPPLTAIKVEATQTPYVVHLALVNLVPVTPPPRG